MERRRAGEEWMNVVRKEEERRCQGMSGTGSATRKWGANHRANLAGAPVSE
tara:strand:- start:98 stop:250 length:153 start_codon:yes stop_codon:yes gene_type:complete